MPDVVAQPGIGQRGPRRLPRHHQPGVAAPRDVHTVHRALLPQGREHGERVGGRVLAVGGQLLKGGRSHVAVLSVPKISGE